MTQVATWDVVGRRFTLHADTRTAGYDPIEAYREWREYARMTPLAQGWPPLIDAEGNNPKGGGLFTPNRALLGDGVRVIPYDSTHTLRQTAEMIGSGLSDFDLYDETTLAPTTAVSKLLDYDKVEIREISTSGGTFTAADRAHLLAIQRSTDIIEGPITLEEYQQIMLASQAGQVTAPASGTAGTVDIKSPITPATVRIRGQVDGAGQRTSTELNP